VHKFSKKYGSHLKTISAPKEATVSKLHTEDLQIWCATAKKFSHPDDL